MSNESTAPNEANTPETEASAANEAAPAAAPAEPDLLALLTEERNALRDQLLRSRADFDNFRKRARRDEDDAKKRAKEDVLRELLPVFDNLERAANFSKSSTDAKAIGEGVVMVLRLFEDTLTRVGGSRLKSVGQVFDPNVHEAIQQVEHDEYPAGVVVQEFVPGYQFADRLLRAAQVVVSKGKPVATEAPKGDDEGQTN
ncbi:MAG: nucleotide exchange factor GrpE [Myxococcales bacterium]|nr:nucleotide exchange factor GrpE [Myxococcales bacterium]